MLAIQEDRGVGGGKTKQDRAVEGKKDKQTS